MYIQYNVMNIRCLKMFAFLGHSDDGSVKVKIKTLQMTRSSIFGKLRLQELMVMFLTVGTMFAWMIATMRIAGWSIMVVTNKNNVNKISEDWEFEGNGRKALAGWHGAS